MSETPMAVFSAPTKIVKFWAVLAEAGMAKLNIPKSRDNNSPV
jgi:hypothetical protein